MSKKLFLQLFSATMLIASTLFICQPSFGEWTTSPKPSATVLTKSNKTSPKLIRQAIWATDYARSASLPVEYVYYRGDHVTAQHKINRISDEELELVLTTGLVPDGRYYEYDPHNRYISQEVEYIHGLPIGVAIWCQEDGSIWQKECWEKAGDNRVRLVWSKKYFHDGKLMNDLQFKNGLKVKYLAFSSEGKTLIDREYKNGKLDGEYYSYFENGNKKTYERYSGGLPEITKEYFPNGFTKWSCEFNLKDKGYIFSKYYENGQLEESARYYYDPDKILNPSYNDGLNLGCDEYQNGIRNGISWTYNRNGKKRSFAIYNRGEQTELITYNRFGREEYIKNAYRKTSRINRIVLGNSIMVLILIVVFIVLSDRFKHKNDNLIQKQDRRESLVQGLREVWDGSKPCPKCGGKILFGFFQCEQCGHKLEPPPKTVSDATPIRKEVKGTEALLVLLSLLLAPVFLFLLLLGVCALHR